MNLRRFLLIVPAVVLLLLLQAAAWVPRYGQTQDPTRLETFIEASSGDARLLNPILYTDTSSGRIVDLVFDGLLKIGDDLKLQGALAHTWSVREEAYLLIDPAFAEPTAEQLVHFLNTTLQQPEHQALAKRITSIEVSPQEARVLVPLTPGGVQPSLNARLPARIKIELTQVVPDLLSNLKTMLGSQYGRGIQRRQFVTGEDSSAWTENELAQRLPLLEHNPIIRFELRTDVQFHDGEVFDARDVHFTYQAIMSPHNLSHLRSNFEPVKALRILTPHRIDVIYKRLFSSAVNAWTVGILPRHLLKDETAKGKSISLRESRFNRRPTGTGAFRFVQWQSSEFIELARNPHYWDGAPLYARYFYLVIPDNLTQELEFRSGAVDAFRVEPHQADRYREDSNYQAFSTLSHGYTYIGYNLRNPLFADAKIRRALGMAIDVQSIIRYVLFGEGRPITGPYPRQSLWYDKSTPTLPYDPQAAVELLNALGWKKNAQGWLERDGVIFEFNLITNNGNLRRKAIASIVQRSWQRIGVKVNVQLFEWAVFLKDFINPGKFDAVVLGWQLELDPDQYQLWHSSQTGPNQLNFVGFKNARADNLIERIRTQYDPSVQIRLARELHALIAREQPYTFLFAPMDTRILDRRIVMLNRTGRHVPVRAGGAGDVFYYMNRWRKLSHEPHG